ncbi:hypothetical protein PTKIN_Ptkin10aG0132400 [Pterospermum kingtungense]
MADNLRRNFPFPIPSSDPQACVTELTRTNSDSSGSGLSFIDPTANARPGQDMVWTNEKHNSYLEFLEASFVEQLHCSWSMRGCHPQKEMWELCPTPQLFARAHNSSHQFSVLKDGCCQKTNYERNDPLLESTADSSDILGSPSLHQSTSTCKNTSATFSVPRETVLPNDGIFLRSNTNLAGCTTEVSDQNFVDEDQREKTGCASGAKRLKKKAMLDSSSNSQVVPLGKSNLVDDSIMSNASAKRGKRKSLSYTAP